MFMTPGLHLTHKLSMELGHNYHDIGAMSKASSSSSSDPSSSLISLKSESAYKKHEDSFMMHTMSYICNCDLGSYLCFSDLPTAGQNSPSLPTHQRSPERKIASPITSPPRGCASPPFPQEAVLVRKSSIKSPTPSSSRQSSAPSTPRKSVRFADSLGLDLEIVRLILEQETTSDVPKDTVFSSPNLDGDYPQITVLPRYLSPNFQQPGALLDFRALLEKQKVCLENAVAYDFTIIGTIKVRNIHYEKFVKIRYSFDGWRTFGDAPASYVKGSFDGPTDRFSFGLSVPMDLQTGGAVEFCVCYNAGGKEYWDNRFGNNYRMECMTMADESTAGDTHFWNHFV